MKMRGGKRHIAGVTVVAFYVLLSVHTVCANSCAGRDYGKGSVVCVCNETYCDKLEPVAKAARGVLTLFKSSRKGSRFEKSTENFVKSTAKLNEFSRLPSIAVNRRVKYQEIFGFGGAFTDAAGINIVSLPSEAKEALMRALFTNIGLEYNMGRVPMASTDFSTHEYSYDDLDDDFELKNFKLEMEDLKYKIPLIQQAERLRRKPLKLFATPWSAPGWMKTSGSMKGFGIMKGTTGDKYHKTWARYYVRFLQAYESHNIKFWGISVQNEPVNGFIPFFPFQAMGYTPHLERNFVGTDLGPALVKAGYDSKKLKLMIMDDQRLFLPYWARVILRDKIASKYVSGIAFHWYTNAWTSPEKLDDIHKEFPDRFIASTEACAGSHFWEREKVSLGNWDRAEAYAYDILTDLLHWTNTWIDWNLALNVQGGPNWVSNFVDSPIIVNASGAEFYKQPMYYAIAHFSKLLPPGSKRIGSKAKDPTMDVGAFLRPDGGTVLIILNRKNVDKKAVIMDPTEGSAVITIPAHSIHSCIWWPQNKQR